MCLHGLLRGEHYFYMHMMSVTHWRHNYVSPRPVTGRALFLYVYDVRNSQETELCVSTACYEDRLTFFIMSFVSLFREAEISHLILNYKTSFDTCKAGRNLYA
jgi:hypothetical protein